MFIWMYRFRFIKKLRDEVECRESSRDRDIKSLREEILILKKICHLKDYRVLERPSFIHFWGSSDQRQIAFDDLREKARKEGYSFVYKREDDDEIWIKHQGDNA